ncbi:testin-like [Pollicipes pollicipes]|uniref:testin-like n=1 Tax=Pollicipes pollicipes TaxID=41117 RepID=UPI001885A1DB|nr:testin-like [Pollicipes pollicipes]
MFSPPASAPSLAPASWPDRNGFGGATLGHEVGQGAPCMRCGSACPGFDLHYWRYANTAAAARPNTACSRTTARARRKSDDYCSGLRRPLRETAELEWVPPGAPPDLVCRYLSQIPAERVPIRGTSGAVLRQRSLQTQLPPQDLDDSRWQVTITGDQAFRGLQGLAATSCRAAMRPGDVAVFAERAGANKCWHPQCFVCATCQELLVDLIYFYESGRVFCGRHYAERLQLGRCPACDELIFSHQFTEAAGHSWHTRHFCCGACGQPLGGRQYVLREDAPLCLPCYQQRHGKTCVTCSRPIAPDGQRVSLGDYMFWHATAECFHCFTCRAGLVDSNFICVNSKVFCSSACASAF